MTGKLAKYMTAAGPVRISRRGEKVLAAVRAGKSLTEAAKAGGMSYRQALRLHARPEVRTLGQHTGPTITLRVPRRVAKAIDLMLEGASERDAAEAAGIEGHHLRKYLDREDVGQLFRLNTLAILRAAIPRAQQIQRDLRTKRRQQRRARHTRHVQDHRRGAEGGP